jgi:hypothetical protein
VGYLVGLAVGSLVGFRVGAAVGNLVGLAVGSFACSFLGICADIGSIEWWIWGTDWGARSRCDEKGSSNLLEREGPLKLNLTLS